MKEGAEKKENIHAHLRRMPPESAEECEARRKRNRELVDENFRRVAQLRKEGKSVLKEFPHLRF